VFQPYFGSIPPLLAIALIAVVGVVSLGLLRSHGWFQISTTAGTVRGVVFAALGATLFGIEVVVADLIIRFPANINVPLPQALLFYPVMAGVAEVSFHALPLALLLIGLRPLGKKLDADTLVWFCILLVSLPEPIYQMGMGLSAKPFSWTDVYVGLHVFTFNLLQLYVFRRYDFVSMYSFRLIYYVYWHIIWGYLRLQWPA
jgi:hypothetical protein